ncbi:CD1375 family protein [Robertmurraya sp. DFI.2.37]|nr:CD1375 family protein [Robertmurraya sp. DFI.2.37]MDF1507618.1 CD1375 family protein [Robertmurraya sp. DFI.2.37]
MAKVYCNLIKLGLWQIDNVPILWRIETQELLNTTP